MKSQTAIIVMQAGAIGAMFWVSILCGIVAYATIYGQQIRGIWAFAFVLYGIFASFEVLIAIPDLFNTEGASP